MVFNPTLSIKDIYMQLSLKEKKAKLYQILSDLGGCVVGFSGGVDSTYLLAAAIEVLGARAVAVSASSETYPEREMREAIKLAKSFNCTHHIVISEELDIPGFSDNPPNRCYYCKTELFSKLREVADAEGLPYVVDGSNLDDRSDYRPGRQAAAEQGVRSPLDEAGLTKDDIRKLSNEMNLPTWDKPAFACLSSRFPYGDQITREKVAQVGKAEEFLMELGLRTLRVRHHDNVARIELGPEDFDKVVNGLRDEVVNKVKEAGYSYVALDLQGYRTGAMNEVLTKDS
jgi:uncharacterized protein